MRARCSYTSWISPFDFHSTHSLLLGLKINFLFIIVLTNYDNYNHSTSRWCVWTINCSFVSICRYFWLRLILSIDKINYFWNRFKREGNFQLIVGINHFSHFSVTGICFADERTESSQRLIIRKRWRNRRIESWKE